MSWIPDRILKRLRRASERSLRCQRRDFLPVFFLINLTFLSYNWVSKSWKEVFPLRKSCPVKSSYPSSKCSLLARGGRDGVLGGQRRWPLKEWRGRASSLISGIEAFRDGSRNSSNFLRKEM